MNAEVCPHVLVDYFNGFMKRVSRLNLQQLVVLKYVICHINNHISNHSTVSINSTATCTDNYVLLSSVFFWLYSTQKCKCNLCQGGVLKLE